MTTDLLDGMNPEQVAAIQHGPGPLIVLAGAGSGKTRVIIHRIAELVRSGVKPSRILAVTFSKNGQLEMERRGAALGLKDVEFRTWHSIALEVIYKDTTPTPWKHWPLDADKQEGRSLDEEEQQPTDEEEDKPEDDALLPKKVNGRYLLRKVLGKEGLDWQGADKGTVAGYIGFCKAWMWEPDDDLAYAYALEVFGDEASSGVEAFRLFNELVEQNKLLTYDDSLLKCVQWFETEGRLEPWASKFDYILQDEAQDASPVQIRLARLLAQGHRNYCVVGDPSQSIFSFRGSDPAFLMSFDKEWPGARVITMFRNYRCGASIIQLANAVIRPAECRLPDDIVAEGGWRGDVRHIVPSSQKHEADLVTDSILLNVSNRDHYRDHAVLYRTNSQSRVLEETLLKAQIPFVVVGGTPFYERKEVKDLLSYLRFAMGVDTIDSMRRSIHSPTRFLYRAFIADIIRKLGQNEPTTENLIKAIEKAANGVDKRKANAANEYASLIQTLGGQIRHGNAPSDVMRYVLERTMYISWLSRDQEDSSVESNQVANVRELLRMTYDFQTVPAMLDYITRVQIETKKQSKDKKADRVLLMTIHKAKGLEWKHVFFTGCSEKLIPHAKATGREREEERRLFYVAVTRAAQTLTISSPAWILTKNGKMDVGPSEFLVEAALQEAISLDGSEPPLEEPEEIEDFFDDKPDPNFKMPPGADPRLEKMYRFIAKHGDKTP